MQDAIVIGAGPAGMTAALYLVRKGYDVQIISRDTGGQALWSAAVENYMGFRLITGLELVRRFEEHVEAFPLEHVFSDVTAVERTSEGFTVRDTEGREFHARAVVMATGKSHRKLDVPGEEKFSGRGVAYCAICDAPLFAGLPVVVVGSGNSGLQAAIQLLKLKCRVTLVESLPRVSGDNIYVDRLRGEGGESFELLLSTSIRRIDGDSMVRSVVVLGPQGERSLEANGVFVEVGWTPNSVIAPPEVEKNEAGEIVVDCFCNTSLAGFKAAGDVTIVPKQIIVAAGEGAKAALAASEHLLRLEVNPHSVR